MIKRYANVQRIAQARIDQAGNARLRRFEIALQDRRMEIEASMRYERLRGNL